MSELRDAVNKVQNLGGLFKAVMIIADEVNKVDKIEQLTGEVNVRLVAKQAEERDIDARLVAGNGSLASLHKALSDTEKDIAAAKKEAKDTISTANEKAKGLIADATGKAAGIVADAEQQKTAIDGQVSDKNKKLAAVEKTISTRSDELAALEKQIQDARDIIKQMVGG